MPEPPIRLLLLLAGEDHPKACTGRRLVRRGLARPVTRMTRAAAPPIVLDPHASQPLSLADRGTAEAGGILAIDCSWNRIGARGGLPPGTETRGVRRRLPFLVAANPQHYGRLGELNTVEALSAALYLLGRPSAAAELLEGFRGGGGFLEINRDRLELFGQSANGDEVLAHERDLYGGSS